MGRNANDRMEDEMALTQKGDDKPVKARRAEKLLQTNRIARFKGATIIEEDGKWLDMSSDRFAEVCYRKFGTGLNKSAIAELEHLFRTTAPDLSHLAHLIAFGNKVWDMKKLDWTDISSEDCVYRVNYEPRSAGKIDFVKQLAKGDEGVYDDIMQSVAPLLMDKKPTGVIWYLGTGANGKSTLVHLLYMIFGPYLTEITVKQLEDERDTPQLNGKLGNICKESSEGYVEDTRTYKSIGTHESFSVHKFHSQDMVEIEGNVHHIFSANNIPTFGDKSYGARRRTLVIPFDNRFKPDETFEDRTFTKQFIEEFLGEVLAYVKVLQEQNYEYRFSAITHAMKEKYDIAANTAQTYAEELAGESVIGFLNYRSLQNDYENWATENGYKPSPISVLRKAMDEQGFARRSARTADGRVTKVYIIGKIESPELMPFDKLRPGIFKLKDGQEDVSTLPQNEQESLLEDF
jgi:phage/plasmid-associated DNA primase